MLTLLSSGPHRHDRLLCDLRGESGKVSGEMFFERLSASLNLGTHPHTGCIARVIVG
jgi:hypothetical protein